MKRSIRTMLDKAGGTGGPGRNGRGAFTLIELLIAVGALALVSAGVAAIFEATGKTVQTGRRVSAMASYASLIERRMREDFASMTRDGFLIIRNDLADGVGDGNVVAPNAGQTNGYCVPLSDADAHPRLRRIDEIMFFDKGQFVSARELLDSRFVAKADAAAIYYGHGQKGRAPDPTATFNANDPYFTPSANASNTDKYARLGFQDPGNTIPAGTHNPNKYASDWILVRQVTLLRQPQTSAMTIPQPPRPFNLLPQQFVDSDVQIGLQPAASNLFRALAALFPTVAPAGTVRGSFDPAHPFGSSGLVDIATTDLSEIKAIVTTADTWPGTGVGTAAGPNFFTAANNQGADGNNAGVDGKARLYGSGANGDQNIIAREQAWMNDALPANSMAGNPNNKARLRCESAPSNYVGVLTTSYSKPEEAPSRRADQIMLSASNFLPHCTEFIVEWSFGLQYSSDPASPDAPKAGQLIWYGMPRAVNGDPVADTYGLPLVNISSGSPWRRPFATTYSHVDGSQSTYNTDYRLIHGQGFGAGTVSTTRPITSYFGYTDPTFDPDQDTPAGTVATGHAPDGLLISPLDSRSPTIPWAWPRFIRVTMSLADPNNPTAEQSFQFVFDVPAAQ